MPEYNLSVTDLYWSIAEKTAPIWKELVRNAANKSNQRFQERAKEKRKLHPLMEFKTKFGAEEYMLKLPCEEAIEQSTNQNAEFESQS